MRVLNPLGVLSSDVATGNLVWVDQVNGNDSLAVRGRMTIPFRTLGAAKAAAQTDETIVVFPGVYNENNLAKNGVNWHFLNGAKVTYTGATSGQLFYVDSTMSFKVTGYGEFTHNGSTGSKTVLAVNNASSSITFKCLKISAVDTCVDVTLASAVLIECDSIDSITSGIGASIASGNVTLAVRSISAYGSHALAISGGTVEVRAARIASFGGKGLSFSGGTATISAVEVVSNSSHGVEYNSASAVLTIIGARLVTAWADVTSRAVYLANGATSGAAPLRLVRCILLGKVGWSGSSIDASGTRVVGLYGENVANISQSAGITFQISTPLKVDTNVT